MLTERWKIADAFDVLVISAEVGIAKPDALIFSLALERLGVSAEEAVFVDDFVENIEAARAYGLHTVHFACPTRQGSSWVVCLGMRQPVQYSSLAWKACNLRLHSRIIERQD